MMSSGRWARPRRSCDAAAVSSILSSAALSIVLVVASACSTTVAPAAVRWSDTATVFKPPSDLTPLDASKNGWLKVETDRDRDARSGIVRWLRRPYDLYAPDGMSIQKHVDNQGWSDGEDPRAVELPAGKYVIASVYGTVYRKVQVEVFPGLTTTVPEDAVAGGPPVFSD
jgi:hypothetical protein